MKRNSWHYKLAKIANDGNRIYGGEMSICEYTWKVLFGLLLFTFGATVLVILFGFFGLGVYELIGSAFGFAVLDQAGMIVLGLAALIIGSVVAFYANYTWREKSEQLLRKDNNSFVANAYKSYKQKVCFRVEFDDER